MTATWAGVCRKLEASLVTHRCPDASQIFDCNTFQKALQNSLRSGAGAQTIQEACPYFDRMLDFAKALSALPEAKLLCPLLWAGLYAVNSVPNRNRRIVDKLNTFCALIPTCPEPSLIEQDESAQSILRDVFCHYAEFCIEVLNLCQSSSSSAFHYNAVIVVVLPLVAAVWALVNPSRALDWSLVTVFQAIGCGMVVAAIFWTLVTTHLTYRKHATRISALQNKMIIDGGNLYTITAEADTLLPKTVLPAPSMNERDREGTAKRITTIPRMENPYFEAGPAYEELKKKLIAPRGSEHELKVCVLYGMGGIGKTQTGLAYAFETHLEYDWTFWIAAEIESELVRTYKLIADELEIDTTKGFGSTAEQISRFLRDTKRSWLLLFDNVETYNAIAHYLPKKCNHSRSAVIITTQKADLGESFPLRIDLSASAGINGLKLLLKLLGGYKMAAEDLEVAQEICDMVGNLPLSIEYIAGSLRNSNYSLPEFLAKFRNRPSYVWETHLSETPYQTRTKQLSAVWDMALEELDHESKKLIEVLAYLNPDSVFESMVLADTPDAERQDNRWEPSVRTTLGNRRLIRQETGAKGRYLVMHRSLQYGILHKLAAQPSSRQEAFDRALSIVRRSTPPSSPKQVPTLHLSSEYEVVLPHIMSLRSGFNVAKNPPLQTSEEFAQLLYDAGIQMWWQGITKDGLLLLETAECILNDIQYNESGRLRADICIIIGIIDDMTGISKKVDSLSRRKVALQIRKTQQLSKEIGNAKKDPNDEILRYNAESDYGCALLQWNRWREAEPLFATCFSKYQEWDPVEEALPFEFGKYYNHTAMVRMYQGRLDEAATMCDRAVKLMSLTSDSASSNQTFRYRYNLACIILQAGDLDLALKMHEEVLEARKKYLGRANSQTLDSFYAVGAMHDHLGELREAEEYIRECITINDEHKCQWPIEFLCRAQYHLAQILIKLGGHDREAEKLVEESCKVMWELIEIDFPDCLKTTDDMMVLFDHLIPAQGGRFTGIKLLPLLGQLPQSQDE